MENGRVAGVKTDHGDINCEIFVNCAGQVSQYTMGYLTNNFVFQYLCTVLHMICSVTKFLS